jgi:hypothetical protein
VHETAGDVLVRRHHPVVEEPLIDADKDTELT